MQDKTIKAHTEQFISMDAFKPDEMDFIFDTDREPTLWRISTSNCFG